MTPNVPAKFRIHSNRSTGFLCLFLIFFLTACHTPRRLTHEVSTLQLKFLNQYIIPNQFEFDNTIVGGLSGIDYDSTRKIYASICDDRSDINPARYYTYQVSIQNDQIDTVKFLNKVSLRNYHNELFPSYLQNKPGSVDPEALRFFGDQIIWSDEGLRQIIPNDTVLVNPRIFLAQQNGTFIDTFPIPDILHMNADEMGPRNNGGFEGLTISPDKKYLMVSVEEPLLQDGPRAGTGDSSGVVRLIKFDIQRKKAIAQYAYRIEPVAHPVNPPSGFRVNGISDIMYLDANHLLVVERSFSTGRITCTIKVFLADLSHAKDISQLNSLKGESYSELPKKLLLNMDDLGIFIDNIEGVTFGPRLSNGNQSLIFISDNNFNSFERTQLLLFECKY